MLGSILAGHFQKIAKLCSKIKAGDNLASPEERTEFEKDLLVEITSARTKLKKEVGSLGRPRPVRIATGEPKGAWAYIYYVSFHDSINSSGPTEGFYPAFLFSMDQKDCWLSIMLAAASVGISGRGGWSAKRGLQLKQRANLLGNTINLQRGWQKGPITLGINNSYLHREHGNLRSAGRAYECGAIISMHFDPHKPPDNLNTYLTRAFGYFDAIYSTESAYIETSVPRLSSDNVFSEQANASIVGTRAEEYFLKWVVNTHPEWGTPVDRRDVVGFGHDIYFPHAGLNVEVKGCRGDVEDVRVTERQWIMAKTLGTKYILALVSHLDSTETCVHLIHDPYSKLSQAKDWGQVLNLDY